MNDPRQDKFVPLTTSTPLSGDRGDLRVSVLRDSSATPAFQPLRAQTSAAPATSAPSVHAHEPQVTLLREGDRITGIQIQCGCGKVIELGCTY
jgi:hypothetical protein